MSKIVTVVGATGIQGASVVQALLNNKGYTVRAITRNRESEKAKALLARGVDVVEANLNDQESLQTAFVGSYAIFGVTNYFEAFPTMDKAQSIAIEVQQGLNLANAAAATESLQHYIWSTLPNSRRVSDGKFIVPHYESKNQIDDYIRAHPTLFNKTTFLWVTFYANNINYPWYMPFSIPNSNPTILYNMWATPPSSMPLKIAGDETVNIGLFAKSILDQPEKTLPGRFVLVATDDMTAGEFTAAWAQLQGKEVVHLQVNKDTYNKTWPKWGDAMDFMHMYTELTKNTGYSSEENVLTKEDLGVTGLVDTKAAFAKMQSRD
ncbi:NAD(P)-binding-containing protein [Coleophoma cylindrospora]|uniref:NAD(P)-binding-containing protein n=1 Tax=Coleophoma cylindrospora TaxID=1849047 RepID=A0A3D8SG31_9HELO|nr:NAD(P)-binding-containing protein [Coleophoma cylindrospora]